MQRQIHGRIRFTLGVILGLAMASLGGCTPWATYPHVEGSVDISNPGLSPIPEIMAEAIWYAHDLDDRGDEIVFNLPENTPPVVYDRVMARLDAARPMRDPDERAYHVTEVRVRTVDSEVDVLHVNTAGEPELMTIRFKQNLLTGFRVASVRPWRFPVDFPPPHYVAREEPGSEPGSEPAQVAEGETPAPSSDTP